MRAAATVRLHGLQPDYRNELEQEGLLELWRKRTAYDQQRGSWLTFDETVVTNKMISLGRTMGSERAGGLRGEPIENLHGLAAPIDNYELRADVLCVLARVSTFDRNVALSLMDHSAMETGQRLRVSRATVYGAIQRLRAAFTAAGFAPRRRRTYGRR